MRRSMMFVPGNNPGMLLNADVYGADSLILDLEDAVAPGEKDAARVLVRNALRAFDYGSAEVIIRINPLGTPYIEDDIRAVVPLKPALIMPTKVAGAEDIHAVSAMILAAERENGLPEGSVGLIPLLETALGIENAYQIATADPRVKAIFLGAEDLSSDLQAIRSTAGDEILYARGARRRGGLLRHPLHRCERRRGLGTGCSFCPRHRIHRQGGHFAPACARGQRGVQPVGQGHRLRARGHGRHRGGRAHGPRRGIAAQQDD